MLFIMLSLNIAEKKKRSGCKVYVFAAAPIFHIIIISYNKH